jgi:hypothetical protein
MSSFLVADRTINRIVTWFHENEKAGSPNREAIAAALSIDPLHPDFHRIFAYALFAMNLAAVTHRYGPDEARRQHPLDYHSRPELPGGDLRVYESLCCLLYQCAEGDIPQSKLFQAATAIRLKIAHSIIYAGGIQGGRMGMSPFYRQIYLLLGFAI